MNKYIIPSIVIVLALILVWYFFLRERKVEKSIVRDDVSYPPEVWASAFGDGEKLKYEGNSFYVVDGVWVLM